MNRQLALTVGLLLSVSVVSTPSSGNELLWSEIEQVSSCEVYSRFRLNLAKERFYCRDSVPKFYRRILRRYNVPGTGVRGCYIGPIEQLISELKGYNCIVASNRRGYNSVTCVRAVRSDGIDFQKESLFEWQPRLYSRASELRSCGGRSLEMAFAGREAVPLDLWKYYEHEIGMVISTRESMLYFGVGYPTEFWKESLGDVESLKLITFFEGSLNESFPLPFVEEEVEIGRGLSIVVTRDNGLVHAVQRYLDLAHLRGELFRKQDISFHLINLKAVPMKTENNLETLLRTREVDVRRLVEDVWLDLEIEFDLIEEYLEHEEIEAMLRPGVEAHGDTFKGIPLYDRFVEEGSEELRFFSSQVTPGCTGGNLLYAMYPPPVDADFEAPLLYFIIGEGCTNFNRIRRGVLNFLIQGLREETVSEMELN